MLTEEEKKKSSHKVTMIVCVIIVAFTLLNMLNTWINYKIEVATEIATTENLKKYHKEEIERLQKIIEILKLIRGEDVNATR